jgi:xanthine dehydrogenase YagS FAD-binding subunit
MKAFTYERATSPAQATAAAGRVAGSRFVAGGTNLLDLMKLEIEAPRHLIDVNGLGFDRIEPTLEGGLRIGALVRNTDLAADPRIRRDYGVLSRALLAGASGQLRNMATTAGNLLQRTRCPYFYDPNMPCNKRKPGSGCAALGGYSRQLAVIGGSEACIATHPSDMAVAMRLLDAVVETVRTDGASRSIPIAELHRLPGDTPHIDHQLAQGELITHVVLHKAQEFQMYRKVRDRSSYAFAVVSIGIAFDLLEDHFLRIRIGLGGVAHKPWRAARAEEVLEGKAPSRALFEKAADAELAEATGQGENDFKIPLMRRLIVASLTEMTTTQEKAA